MPARPRARGHLRALTGIRFLAAFWVLAFHNMPRLGLPVPVLRFVEAGYLGVSLFFVLSGFILAHVYEPDILAREFSARTFLRARFARVYPAYLAGLVLAIPLFLHGLGGATAPRGTTLAGICAANVMMLQAWVPGWGCTWNCPGWSLSVEAFFYVAFIPLATWLLRQRDRRIALVAAVAAAALALVGLSVSDGAAVAVPGWGSVTQAMYLTPFTPFVRLPEFVLGMCASRLLRRPSGQPYLGRARWSLTAGALIAVIAVGTSSWPAGGMASTAAIAVPSTLLIAALADPSRPSWLGSNLLVRLGNASYSLYLIHSVVFAYFLAAANRTLGAPWGHSWLGFGVYVIGVVGLSLLMHDYLEVPARRLLRGRAALPAVAPSW